MKKLIISFLLFVFVPALGAQIKMMIESELAELNKVKTMKDNGLKQIKVYLINIDEADVQEDSVLSAEMFFDSGENKFTEISYSPQYSKSVLKLTDGNYIDKREIFNEKGELTGKTLYTYTGNGLLDKRELYFGNVKSFDEIYDYENNVLVKMKYISAEGILLSYTVYNSDSHGNITEEIKYNAEDKADFKYEYIYDASGRCTEERIILTNDSFTSVFYSYDKGNNITEKMTKDSIGKIISFDKFSYKNGLLSEESGDSKDSKVRKTYEYKNNLLWQMKFVDLTDATSYYVRYYYK